MVRHSKHKETLIALQFHYHIYHISNSCPGVKHDTIKLDITAQRKAVPEIITNCSVVSPASFHNKHLCGPITPSCYMPTLNSGSQDANQEVQQWLAIVK